MEDFGPPLALYTCAFTILLYYMLILKLSKCYEIGIRCKNYNIDLKIYST